MKWEHNSYALVADIWHQSFECNFSVQAESYLLSFLLMQKLTLANKRLKNHNKPAYLGKILGRENQAGRKDRSVGG